MHLAGEVKCQDFNIKLICQPNPPTRDYCQNALKGQTCVYLLMTIQEFILDLARLHGAQAGVEFAEFMYAKAFFVVTDELRHFRT